MKKLPIALCALSLPLLIAAGVATRPTPPSIQGNYILDYRELPDGKKLRSPDVFGMMTFTREHRNFNVFWTDNGKQGSISAIAHYTLTDKEYTEDSLYYAANMADGKGISYETTKVTGKSPVTTKGAVITIKFPNHDEPEVTFDKIGLTATRKGAFVDHWKKAD